MALNFTPPPDWLIQDYLTRKAPAQQASDSVNQALQSYTALKQQQAAQKQGQVKTYIDAMGAGGPKFASDVASQIGLDNPPTVPQAQPPTVSTAPVQGSMMPTATEEAAQQSIQGEHPQAPLSPIVQASLAAGHPNHAGLQIPGGEDPVALANMGKYGRDRLDTLERAQKLDDAHMAHLEKTGKKSGVTDDQILANGFDPVTQIKVNPKDTSAKDQKYENEQNRLEGQAIDRISKLRGDASLARTENQRDAAIQAYNTIQRIKQEGRMPSQLEYFDILGQMWKARTGASPTDQALRDLDAKTLKGDLGKAYQYFSGKPAGVTTGDVLQNIQDFAADSGLQSDKFHASYMDSHKLKPSGLEQSRWDPIFNAHRGMSFVEATGYKPKEVAPAHQAYADPAKEKRYQEWKASQR